MTYPTVLPPGSTPLEKALEQVAASLLDLSVPVRAVWSPQDCPAEFLPWLAWGLSVDVWNADWPEETKRQVIAESITAHREKGTLASVRRVLDRVDPLIKVIEWFDDRETLDPYCFRLELPFAHQSDVAFDEKLVAQLVRDVSVTKPTRAHMQVGWRVFAETQAWLFSGSVSGGLIRLDSAADTASALDPTWDDWLQTEDGEPIEANNGQLLEV